MYCPKCGVAVIEGANFCMNCGLPLAQYKSQSANEDVQTFEEIGPPDPKNKSDQLVVLAQNAFDENNFESAIKLYAEAIKLGNTKAMIGLAGMYLEGNGVEQDAQKSLEWFQKAAELGDADAKDIIDFLNSNEEKPAEEVQDDDAQNDDAQADDAEKELADFYDEREDKFIIPLGGHQLRLDGSIDELIDVLNELNNGIIEASTKFMSFYKSAGNIEEVVGAATRVGNKILHEFADVGVKFCMETGRYDITADMLLNEPARSIRNKNGRSIDESADEIPSKIWLSCTNFIGNEYGQIVNKAQSERDYRKMRKENRDRFVGGGYGIDGAIYGAIDAGILNLTTGAAHSIFNAAGNLMTSMQESSDKSKLYEDKRTLMVYISGIESAAENIKLRALFIMGFDKIKERQSECASILENLKGKKLNAEVCKKASVSALNADPFNFEAYQFYVENFHDPDGELQRLADFFSMGEQLSKYKSKLLREILTEDKNVPEGLRQIVKSDTNIEEIYFKNKNVDINVIERDYNMILEEAESFQIEADDFEDVLSNYKSLIEILQLKDKPASEARIESLSHCGEGMKIFEVSEGVKSIGRYAFANCKNLFRIVLPSTLETIEAGAFCGCKILKEINFPVGLKTIERDAFKNCNNVRWIELPDGVETISLALTNNSGRGAQKSQVDKFIWLPPSIKKLTDDEKIDVNVKFGLDLECDSFVLDYFIDNELTDLIDASEVIVMTREFAGDSKMDIFKPSKHLKTVHDEAFVDCKELIAASFPYGTKTLGSRLFKGCRQLKFVSIPDSVETIGENILEGTSATVFCSADSVAGKYCRANGLRMEDRATAQYKEGLRLLDSSADEKVLRRALDCFKTSAKYGSLDALYEQAVCNLKGIGYDSPVLILEALDALKDCAKFGHKKAMYQLYLIYRDGNSLIDKDQDEADYWLRSSGFDSSKKSGAPDPLGNEIDDDTFKEKLIGWNEKYGGLRKMYFAGMSSKAKRKIDSAIEEYARTARLERVIFVFDDTVFGGAEDGFLVTDKKIYIHNKFKEATSISLKSITELTAREEEHSSEILLNDGISINLTGYKRAQADSLIELIKDLAYTFGKSTDNA